MSSDCKQYSYMLIIWGQLIPVDAQFLSKQLSFCLDNSVSMAFTHSDK